MKNSNEILLSICIPTFNRAKALDGNLHLLNKQISGKELLIELIVSDNCSVDNTSDVVNKYIENGMPINYIKNKVNLGMDGNFAQCYRMANGKYVLVLGDDDYLIDGMLDRLLNYLKSGDYGLVHLKTYSTKKIQIEQFTDSALFLKNISFWITYITSNIVNSKYISEYNFEKNFGTYLTIVPLYLNAALKHGNNLLIHDRVFSDGIDQKTNGGYNFFQVFIVNYLDIWSEFKVRNKINKSLYNFIKRDILKYFLVKNIYYLLIKKKENRYDLQNSFSIIKKYYFFHGYFYYYMFMFLLKYNLRRLLEKLKLFNK